MLEQLRQNAESWGIKIAFAIIILVFVFSFGMGSFQDKKESVVAYVDGKPISAREYQKAYEDTITAMRRQNPGLSAEELNTPQMKQGILGQLVNTKLILAAAEKMGITVSSSELRALISSLPAFQNAQNSFDPGLYKNALAQNHTSPERFENELKSNQIVQKLQSLTTVSSLFTEPEAKSLFQWAREKIRMDYVMFPASAFMDKVKPTDEEIKAFYESSKDRFKQPALIRLEYLPITVSDMASSIKIDDAVAQKQYNANADSYTHPEQLHARHILLLVQPNADKAQTDRLEGEIKSISAQLKKGGNFEALAKKLSQDPGTAPHGGELPWFSRGMMVKPFEDAAFALKPGQISEPVRTQYGWHIIKLEATRPAGKVPFEDAKEEIKRRLAEEKASEKVNEIMDQSLDQMAAGVKLEKIAKDLGLATKKSDLLDAAGVQRTFSLKKEAVESLFALAVGTAAKTPLSMEPAKGYLLAEKIEDQPESVMPLEKVRDKVLAELKLQDARKLALEKAQATLTKLMDPATAEQTAASLKGELKTTPPMDRQAAIAQTGGNPQLLMAIFAAQNKSWLKTPFELPSGVTLARLNERIGAPEEEWVKEKRFWTTQGSAAFRQELFNALLTNLRSTAKIEIVRQDLVN